MRTPILVVCSTIEERWSLLIRSIPTWVQSAKRAEADLNIVLYCDGFAPRYEDYRSFPLVWLRTTKEPSGSHVKGYNWAVSQLRIDRTTFPEVIFFTHPEIMFGRDVIGEALSKVQDAVALHYQVHWIKKSITELLPDRTNYFDPSVLLEDPAFLDYSAPEDAQNKYNVDRSLDDAIQSTTTYAVTPRTAKKMFPLPEFGCWGPDDPYTKLLRERLGIKTLGSDSFVYHQPHKSLCDWAKYTACVNSELYKSRDYPAQEAPDSETDPFPTGSFKWTS